jgi:hypothetical protein
MTIRTLAWTAILSCSVVTYAHAQTPPKPEPKTEAKPEPAKAPTAASLADNWTVSVDANGQTIEAALVLKADAKDPKKITGTITGPQGEAAIQGEVVAGKLNFSFTMNSNGTEVSITVAGTQQKDGSLAGTMAFAENSMNWTAMRVKK